MLLSYYTPENDREEKTVTVTIGGASVSRISVLRVDDESDYREKETVTGNTVTLKMKPNTFLVLKSEP